MIWTVIKMGEDLYKSNNILLVFLFFDIQLCFKFHGIIKKNARDGN